MSFLILDLLFHALYNLNSFFVMNRITKQNMGECILQVFKLVEETIGNGCLISLKGFIDQSGKYFVVLHRFDQVQHAMPQLIPI